MKKIFLCLVFVLLISTSGLTKDIIYNLKQISTFVMKPDNNSPIIYPLELGHELQIKNETESWYNVLDKKTGLQGWVLKENFGPIKPENSLKSRNYEKSFEIFKEKVLEMSTAIEEAIGAKTFLDIKHLGGVSAKVYAADSWFKGRRYQGQAFQVYEMWKSQNQSPSFLSFRKENDEEQFIVLSGPHKPRMLKASKNP